MTTGGVRGAAARVLDEALAQRRPVDPLLERAAAGLAERDRGLLRELVLGGLRWLRRLDAVLAGASSRPLERIDRELLGPLRIALYQLLFLDRVPAYAAVSEAVGEARRRTHRGGAGFVNGVLRRVAASPRLEQWPVREEDPVRRLAIETSHPDLLVERWMERFGAAATAAMLAANNRPKPYHLLAFSDRGGRDELARELAAEGLEAEPSALSPLGLIVRRGDPRATRAWREGRFYLMDEASQAAALVPPPRPGERVLDGAAAPGGKSFALLAREPSTALVCADLSPARIDRLRANAARLGRRAPVAVADARRLPFARGFDRVVLDLPCSGTGTLRKHPELKWRISREEIDRLAAAGLELLRGAAPQVAPGGLLVAITCSLEEEENEALGRELRRERPGLEPAELERELPDPFRAQVAGPGLWRVLPGGDHDGFTVQVYRTVR